MTAAAPALCQDPAACWHRARQDGAGCRNHQSWRNPHIAPPALLSHFHPVLIKPPLPRAAVPRKEGGVCLSRGWRRMGVSGAPPAQQPGLPRCHQCTFWPSRVGKVGFWGRKSRSLWWSVLCKLPCKPRHRDGWCGWITWERPVLWFQLIFLAVISLNFRGSLGLASDADIL